jgi:hypothetical protein
MTDQLQRLTHRISDTTAGGAGFVPTDNYAVGLDGVLKRAPELGWRLRFDPPGAKFVADCVSLTLVQRITVILAFGRFIYFVRHEVRS